MSMHEQEYEYQDKIDLALWRELLRYATPYRTYLVALAGRIETGLSYSIRQAGFRRLQELSFSFYDNKAVGWLMARMTSDSLRLGEIVSWGLVDLVWGFSSMLAITAIMFYLHWRLALITLTVVPFLVVVSLVFQKRILHQHRNVRRINSRITGAFNEGITGAKTTKILGRERKNLEEFQELTGSMRQSAVRVAIFSALYLPLVLNLGGIGSALALGFGGAGVLQGAVTYGVLIAFIAYAVQFFEPVRELARIFTELQAAHASAERVLTLIHTEPEITDSPAVIAEYGDCFYPNKEKWPPLVGSITFRNVSFAYNPKEPVLRDFNLEVKAGQTIALVGETGSGKSTIVNLACRFYEPTQGEIRIDGIDYRKRPLAWLHHHLGYVLQSPHLFSGTIMENIRYGRLEASDEEVIDAAKLVNAHPFITTLEKGYHTEVGEGGGMLSTGEKQLVSFARAVVADPQIFVLDEATSSIDTETELLIQNAIQQVLQGRTSFIIAHRLSTIRAADRILVIRDGVVQEEGNHAQLMELNGYYYSLYTNQFMEEQGKQLLTEGA